MCNPNYYSCGFRRYSPLFLGRKYFQRWDPIPEKNAQFLTNYFIYLKS